MTPDQTSDDSFSLTSEDPDLAPAPKSRCTSGPAVFKDYDSSRDQRELFASNVFDLLPEEHDCFLFADLFTQLDTRAAEKRYSAIGQRAYNPKQLISILIYAYSHGVFSSRQIERRCREDLGFMYIAGSRCPSHRVLRDFRRHHAELFSDCFKQTARLGIELKLASLGHVSLDGSKFKANTSKHKAMSYNNLKKQEQALSRDIDALLAQATRCDEQDEEQLEEVGEEALNKELAFKRGRLEKIRAAKAALEEKEQRDRPDETIADTRQISFADHDANIMGKKGAPFEYSYNAQISVDSTHQMIVGQGVSDRANDYGEAKPSLALIQSSCERLPETMSLDNGYYSGENLEALSEQKVEAFIATNRCEQPHSEAVEESTRSLIKSDFSYDADQDEYICPMGKVLKRVGNTSTQAKRQRFRALASECHACSLRDRCIKGKGTRSKTLVIDDKEPLRREMNRRMNSERGRAIYDKRKVIVEPVFGQIKNGGFRGFKVRGKCGVEGEFSLVCMAHNLKKIVQAMTDGLIRPQMGKWAVAAV